MGASSVLKDIRTSIIDLTWDAGWLDMDNSVWNKVWVNLVSSDQFQPLAILSDESSELILNNVRRVD